MSRSEFSDDCAGCRPVVIDVKTGLVLPPDSSTMRVINTVWAKTTKQEREAFHRVTCLNSRTAGDLRLMKGIVDEIERAAP